MTHLDVILFENPASAWLTALAAACTSLALASILKLWVARRFADYARSTRNTLDDLAADILEQTNIWVLIPVYCYLGARFVELPSRLDVVLRYGAICAAAMQVALWCDRFVYATFSRTKPDWEPNRATTMTFVGLMLRGLVWALAVLAVLDTLGFDVTALIAGLGIGGIAVALAAQAMLGDIFASLSIVLDKPFLIGDFIIVDDAMGTVEYIGIKTTRVRSLGGEQLIFSNADLLRSRIRNYKRMYERRVQFDFGVTYETQPAQLAGIPNLVREVIEACGNTRFDRAHFAKFGDFALAFEVVYYVLDPDFNVYMDAQQKINLALCERFAADKIEFAYPTQTIRLQRTPAVNMASAG